MSTGAEWCEHDPIEIVTNHNGEEVKCHLFVACPNTSEGQQALKDWHKDSKHQVRIHGEVLIVTGPTTEFRTWAEVRHPKPVRTFGKPDSVYQHGEVVSIAVAV